MLLLILGNIIVSLIIFKYHFNDLALIFVSFLLTLDFIDTIRIFICCL